MNLKMEGRCIDQFGYGSYRFAFHCQRECSIWLASTCVAPIDFANAATARNSSMPAVGQPTVSDPANACIARATPQVVTICLVISLFLFRGTF